MRRTLLAAAVVAVLATQAVPIPTAHSGEPPPDLRSLQQFVPEAGSGIPFAAEKRAAAVRLAALGFGARAGLARRAWEIAAMLDRHAARMSAVYRFGDLMLNEGGFGTGVFPVLPPVVAETRQAFRLGRAGTRAASAERVLRIVEPAKLVSAPPDWRGWLYRSWPPAEPPASVLFPRDDEEDDRWRRLLAEGWARGRALADDIFAADLDRLNRTFEGVILWHRLHRAARVSAPDIEIVRAGVAGHERLVRIGSASARIARAALFELDTGKWAPPQTREPDSLRVKTLAPGSVR